MSLTQQQKDQRYAEAILSNQFQDLRKNKCVDLGKRIANKQIRNEDIIIQVAELASQYIVWMRPISDPENGKLVEAIANGDAQFVIEYFKKYNSNPFPYFDAFPKEGAAPAPLYMRLSQVSDIFLTMMSDDELNEYAARNIIFVKLLELFGGYFLLGAELEMDKNGNDAGKPKITVEKFQNIGTRYDYHDKYPEDVKVHFKTFVYSTFGRNLKYDKFVPGEIREAMKSPFPKNLSLQAELSYLAKQQIEVVKEAQSADIKKQQSAREASAAASEAARKAAQDEQDKREAAVEAAHAAFEASGNASQSVIGANTIFAKGGRRTRHKRSDKRSGHKKRSGHNKRSAHKRSGHKSGRR
jgi:hypothetical protein